MCLCLQFTVHSTKASWGSAWRLGLAISNMWDHCLCGLKPHIWFINRLYLMFVDVLPSASASEYKNTQKLKDLCKNYSMQDQTSTSTCPCQRRVPGRWSPQRWSTGKDFSFLTFLQGLVFNFCQAVTYFAASMTGLPAHQVALWGGLIRDWRVFIKQFICTI